MHKTNELPFERGQTACTGLSSVDATVLDNLEGKEYVVEDVNPATGVVRTGRPVRIRLVRNKAPFALLPKRAVKFSLTAGQYGSQVIGYNTLLSEHVVLVDEYLPAAGVAVDDLFYVVIEGPALGLTALEGDATNVITVGLKLVALAGATSGATSAGRLGPQDLTGATAVLGNAVQNAVGRAQTARTTSNTSVDVLVDCGKW